MEWGSQARSLAEVGSLTPTPYSFWVYLGGEQRKNLPAWMEPAARREQQWSNSPQAGFLSPFQIASKWPISVRVSSFSFSFQFLAPCISFSPPFQFCSVTASLQSYFLAKRHNSSWRLSEQLRVFKAGQTKLGSTVLLGLVKPDHQLLLRQKVWQFNWINNNAYHLLGSFPSGSEVKNLPTVQGTRVWSLGQEDPLEKEITTHCSILGILGNPMDRGDWWVTVHGITKESDMTCMRVCSVASVVSDSLRPHGQ